ncbi:MAG: hypothetical protein L6R41_003792 [Letrouitia leprolyta]|nr:MAG: hypothetical protein L6R41_003792 [Letrouitia leprolyta]
MARETSSPATMTVQGFTPINRSFDFDTSLDTNVSTAQAEIGANKGKKRQRKNPSATRDPAEGALSRALKKSKQRSHSEYQETSHVFNITKPHTKAFVDQQEPKQEPILGIATETGVHALDSHGIGHLESLEDLFSPATSQPVKSPIAYGLGSIYQAAFKQGEKRSAPNESSSLELSSVLPATDSDSKTRNSACESALSAADVEATQPTPEETLPLSWRSAFELDSILDQTGIGSVCQVPCSSPVYPGSQRTETMDAEPIATNAQLLPSKRSLSSYNLTKWDMMGSRRPHPHKSSEGRCSEILSPQWNSCEVNNPDSDNLLLVAGKDEYSPMQIDQDEPDLSFLISEFVNSQVEVQEDSPESLNPSPEHSFSSDIDILKAIDEKDLENISSDVSFVEASSPYLRSRSDLQKDFEEHDISTKSTPFHQGPDSEESYDDDEAIEAVLAGCQSPLSAQVHRPSPPSSATSPFNPTTPSKLKTEPVIPEPKQRLSKIKNISHKISFYPTGTPKPFIRPPFPIPVRDRSPVVGFGSATLLRTCFRIGEALNAGSLAIRNKQDTVIELYACVVSSERPPNSVKQSFHFADIFSPEKPPFLKGTYGLWKGSELWDLDSKVFLGEKRKGKMARVVGRMAREEKSRGLEMTVLSIWEANWEDVGMIRGVVCG